MGERQQSRNGEVRRERLDALGRKFIIQCCSLTVNVTHVALFASPVHCPDIRSVFEKERLSESDATALRH
jgi:hypothetical protein